MPSGETVSVQSMRNSFSNSVDALEEESQTDRDYYLTAATIDILEAGGADAQLVGLLREALAGREGMDVRWARE